MIKNLIKQGYNIFAEDADTLKFYKIDNITEEVEKSFKIYEIDHTEKVIYLESIKPSNNILIVTKDDLELPLAVVDNFNQAAEFLNVTATHLYRAWRNAGRPDCLTYKDYILLKI